MYRYVHNRAETKFQYINILQYSVLQYGAIILINNIVAQYIAIVLVRTLLIEAISSILDIIQHTLPYTSKHRVHSVHTNTENMYWSR